eukprot:Selendium_serpulae@DN5449_c0_g1_i1.p1
MKRPVEVVKEEQALLGECPRWDSEAQCLFWVDINRFELHRLDSKTGKEDVLTFSEEVGCFSLRKSGGFVLGMRSGFYVTEGWDTKVTPITDPEKEMTKSRFNDGRCDAVGRFIAGTYYPPKDRDAANLWSLDKGEARLLFDGCLTTNGVAFSLDNKIMYYSDTPKHVIYQADYDVETGRASNRQIFHQFPTGNGRPDGASVDAEGHYWVALYEGGRIVRIDPKGNIVEEIPVPAKCPTMVAFGDSDLKTLYITTAGNRPESETEEYPHNGKLLKVRVDVAGREEAKFGA